LPLQALIFDFDGTIVDTETVSFQAWSTTYARWGLQLRWEDWQHCIGTVGGFDPLRALRPHGEQACAEAQRLSREYLLEGVASEPLRPGVGALLEEAQAAGLRLAVASSSDRAWVERWLAHHRLANYFQAICTADDAPRVKPHPDLYLLAVRRLGVDAEHAMAIEDSPHGATAALRAGLRCVVVPNDMTARAAFPAGCVRLETLAVSLDELRRLA
jgi:HAD superfamily hydrolase (TIGR01509 family)